LTRHKDAKVKSFGRSVVSGVLCGDSELVCEQRFTEALTSSGRSLPAPDLQRRILDWSDRDALQVRDRMADGFAHPSHLAVASLADRDDERGLLGVTPVRQQSDVGRFSAPASMTSPRESRARSRSSGTPSTRASYPRDTMSRMYQARGQIAIIGESSNPSDS
jgi:hypothetical protein